MEHSQGGWQAVGLTKSERRSNGDGPANSDVGGVAGGVLVYREGAVDAGAVHRLALLVQPPHGGAHALHTKARI